MDGWMDGWLDGWMAGWLDGWMAGWLAGWVVAWMGGGQASWHAEGHNSISWLMERLAGLGVQPFLVCGRFDVTRTNHGSI